MRWRRDGSGRKGMLGRLAPRVDCMQCAVVKIDPAAPDAGAIAEAAALLRAGQLVAFPTETVYGLGANALDAAAVERIYGAKGRPHYNPLIVHVASVDLVRDRRAVVGRPGRSPGARLLARSADARAHQARRDSTRRHRGAARPWPCACRRTRSRTRCCAAAQLPVAAPSANRSMQLSPTTGCARREVARLRGRHDSRRGADERGHRIDGDRSDARAADAAPARIDLRAADRGGRSGRSRSRRTPSPTARRGRRRG